MDQLSVALLRLVQLGTPDTLPPGLVLAPLHDMLATLFDDSGDGTMTGQIADTLTAIAQGQQDLASGFGRVHQLVTTIEAQPGMRDQLQSRLAAFNQALMAVQTLGLALHSQLFGPLELQLRDMQLFQFIQQLSLKPKANAPEVIFVGAVPRSLEKVTVRLGKRTPLDRIEIAYAKGSPFPLLSLSTASKGEQVAWATGRSNWRQEDGPDFALEIQNSTGARSLGSVETAYLSPGYVVEGTQLAVRLPALQSSPLLATTVCDTSGRPLAQCVKVLDKVSG